MADIWSNLIGTLKEGFVDQCYDLNVFIFDQVINFLDEKCSFTTAPFGGKMRDPGNEVDKLAGEITWEEREADVSYEFL